MRKGCQIADFIIYTNKAISGSITICAANDVVSAMVCVMRGSGDPC
jgi:hypothetical protein